MKRAHLFEFHDQGWFPKIWRDCLTDSMSFFALAFRPYRAVADRLGAALRRAGAKEVVDLCSGAGGPIISIAQELRRHVGLGMRLTLTDKYPNVPVLRAAAARWGTNARVVESQVDACGVPPELPGFRTLFTSFHHFRPDAARAILADAVRKRQGIGIFEYTERNFLIWGLPILSTPAFIWMVTPLIRPFAWRRLLWTFLVPVVPLAAAWDGLVSCLRTYSPAELRILVAGVGPCGYDWAIGRVRSFGACHITYLVGWPEDGGMVGGANP